MALATYNDLLSAVANWLNRSGDTAITGNDDDLVTLCESRIHLGYGSPGDAFYSPALRTRQMEAVKVIPVQATQDGGTSSGTDTITVTLSSAPTAGEGLSISFTAGGSNTGAATLNPNSVGAVDIRKGSTQTALAAGDIVSGASHIVTHDGTYYRLMPSAGAIPLPTDFLGIRSVFFQGSPLTALNQVSPAQFDAHSWSAANGTPRIYCIEGDVIRFGPRPDTNYYLVVNYYKKMAALSGTVNRLFTDAPNIYLFGTLLEACIFLGDWDNAVKNHALFMGAVKGLAHTNQMDRYGAAPLTMRISGPTP